MTEPTLSYSKDRIRYAVLSFFIAQGLCFACFFSRLPDLKEHYGISDLSDLALLLSLLPIGKFIAIPSVGFLLPLIKSKKTTIISLTGFIVTLFLIGLTPNIYIFGLLIFLFGIFWNMTDISLNTQAIEVERIYGKSIIATFHAGWSVSACIGALIGFIFINLNLSIFNHFAIMSVITLLIVGFNTRYLLNDTTASAEANNSEIQKKQVKKKSFRLPETILIQLGVIWLIALIIENTIFDWSDIYFQSVIKAPKTLQIGFLICMVMISVGRFLANKAYRIWSKTTVLKLAGSFLFIGFTLTAVFFDIDNFALRIIINSFGFMLIGLGISCVVPTIYSIVGEKAKTPIGTALTIMSSISFLGPLISPSLVAHISKRFGGMEWAYLIIGCFGAIIVIIASVSKSLKKKN